MKNVELLSTVEPFELGQIADALKAKKVEPNTQIIKQDEEGNEFYIPNLYMDEIAMFGKKGTYSDVTKCAYFLAYKEGKLVGRIQAINQLSYNELHKSRQVRFGRFDSINGEKTFIGYFKNGEREGFGILTETDGKKYEGYWKNNKANVRTVLENINLNIKKGETVRAFVIVPSAFSVNSRLA